MASFFYTKALQLILAGDIDFDEAGDDMRVRLVMTNTTADTEKNVDTWAGFTTPDEMDGANYTAGGELIGSQTTTEDEANDRAEFDGANITYSSLGAGTRQVQAAILVKYVDAGNGDIPIAYIDTGGFPFTANGGDVTISWNTEGIIQLPS